MGEKDITEKNLVMFADVFADIVNNFLLEDGEEKIKPEDLLDVPGWSMLHSLFHGEPRSQIRDTAKLLKIAETIIALLGLGLAEAGGRFRSTQPTEPTPRRCRGRVSWLVWPKIKLRWTLPGVGG